MVCILKIEPIILELIIPESRDYTSIIFGLGLVASSQKLWIIDIGLTTLCNI